MRSRKRNEGRSPRRTIARSRKRNETARVVYQDRVVYRDSIVEREVEKEKIDHPVVGDVPVADGDEGCVICMTNAKVIAGKCGHLTMCCSCSEEVYKSDNALCPLCREPWTDLRRIFG